jgi:hypothetical protein
MPLCRLLPCVCALCPICLMPLGPIRAHSCLAVPSCRTPPSAANVEDMGCSLTGACKGDTRVMRCFCGGGGEGVLGRLPGGLLYVCLSVCLCLCCGCAIRAAGAVACSRKEYCHAVPLRTHTRVRGHAVACLLCCVCVRVVCAVCLLCVAYCVSEYCGGGAFGRVYIKV